MPSQSILKHGKAPQWRMDLCNKAILFQGDGHVYQQKGVGVQTLVIHACRNMGEPFDGAKHRAAKAMWAEVEKIAAKPTRNADREEIVEWLRLAWDAAE